MDIQLMSLQFVTLSPLHHGFTEPVDYGFRGAKYRAVRQTRIVMPQDDGNGHITMRAVTVPVLGANALRGRLRRYLAYETFRLLGLDPQSMTPQNTSKLAFHTLTSGGALVAQDKTKKDQASDWTQFPAYRQHCLAQWPLLSLMGFSLKDFMVPSKLRVSFGWPLIKTLQPLVSIAEDTTYGLFPTEWADIKPSDLIQGDGKDPEAFHLEYKHADTHVMPMQTAGAGTVRDKEYAAMVMAMQYVPTNVPFGVRLTALNLTPLEASALRLGLEAAFPRQDTILFGGRAVTGLGLMRVTNHSGIETLPDPDIYRDFLRDHRDALLTQIADSKKFFTDAEALKTLKAKSEKKKEV